MATARSLDLDETLAALADPYRRRTIDLLREYPRRAGELAEALGLPPSSMSRHLGVLRHCGLVEAHEDFDARVRLYSLRLRPFVELRSWLEETERLSSGQAAPFQPGAD